MNKESIHLTTHNLGLLKPRLNTAPQSVSDRRNLCRIPHRESILLWRPRKVTCITWPGTCFWWAGWTVCRAWGEPIS